MPSWRSTSGTVLIGCVVLEAIFVSAAVMAYLGSNSSAWAFGAFAVFAAVLIWLIGPLFIGRKPYLQFDQAGIRGKGLRGKPVSWKDVENINLQSVHGHGQLCIELLTQPGRPAKRSFLTGLKSNQRIVPLGAIRSTDHPEVLQAAQEAFILFAPATAVKAMEATVEEMEAVAAFDSKLRELTPRVWAMPTVMAACVVVWGASVAFGMNPFQPAPEELFQWGANSASAVQKGQWWRLVSAMFLHGGVIHLALNMFALWEAGLLVSRLFGNRGFLLIYFGAGIAGSAFSLHYAAQTNVSVGASGAVFGVAGALLATVIQHRGKFPVTRSKQLMTSMGIFIVYSLLNGFAKQGIDNAAHIGGLIAGVLLGWLLVEKIDDVTPRSKRLSHAMAAAALCVFGTTAVVLAAPSAKVDTDRYFSDLKTWQSVQPDIEKFKTAMQQDAAARNAGKLDDASLQERFEAIHLPALQRVVDKLSGLDFPADEMPGRYINAQRHLLATTAALLGAQLKYAKEASTELEQSIQQLSEQMQSAKVNMEKINAEVAKRKTSP